MYKKKIGLISNDLQIMFYLYDEDTMKSNAKSNLIILGILLAFLPIITSNISYFTDNNNKTLNYCDDFTLDNKNVELSKLSGKIYINGNSGWITAKAVGTCTGSGTYFDPYIIEDLEIDGGGSGSCILIENSNVYFKIENCTVYNSGLEWNDAGISLSFTTNSQLINNNCSFNYKGIYLSDSDYSTVSGNTANNNNLHGIWLENSNNNNISGNTANYNMYGIFLLSCNYNLISGNTANNNTYYGIALSVSSNDTILGNTANNNTYYGIFLWGSNNNTITKNIINYNNITGIVVDTSNGNNIYLNCFNNILNAIDNGSNNHWDNGINGNYWADYADLDIDGNGIGDVPYNINGSAGSRDYFPLMKCPNPTSQVSEGVPGYNLFFLFGILSLIVIILSKKLKKS